MTDNPANTMSQLLTQTQFNLESFVAPVNQTEILTQPKAGKPKILVTGGAGYIGSHTVQALQQQGHDVIVLDNLSTGYASNVNCPLIVGDVGDAKLLDKIFTDFNIGAVLHFAASLIVEESVAHPEIYFQNNVVNGLSLLNAMVNHNVNKIVFSSTAAVYGNPQYLPINEEHFCQPANPYGESKLMFERILKCYQKSHNVSSVSLRYFNASGASIDSSIGELHDHVTHLIPRVLRVASRQQDTLQINGNNYNTVDGTCVRDYIHVSDLAQAHILALDKLAKDEGVFAYNVGTGNGYSVAQIADVVVEITSKMVPIEYGPRREGDPESLVADPSKIKTELGFTPQYSDLRTIIESAWNWHKKRFNIPDRKKKTEEVAKTA